MIATQPAVSARSLPVAALASGGLAAALNLVVYFLARAFGVPLQVVAPGTTELQALPFFPVIFASLIPAFVAAGLLALLVRFTARPVLIFQVISAVFLVLSFASPLAMPTDGGTKFALNLMHAVAAAAIVFGLLRFARTR